MAPLVRMLASGKQKNQNVDWSIVQDTRMFFSYDTYATSPLPEEVVRGLPACVLCFRGLLVALHQIPVSAF
eukprot:5550293-Pleurochrysis_carterae.AAC.1